MLGSDLFFRDKIRVGILGATGNVGQNLYRLLKSHPWFELTAVTASEQSQGKPYLDSGLTLSDHCKLPCTLLFSALDHPYAKEVEAEYARQGYIVVSNAKSHRMEQNVPLMIPEVNEDHLEWLQSQGTKGKIVTVPNCSAVGLTLALKPLVDLFGVERVHIVTMQAISGAGRAAKDLDIEDNIIPFIHDEEEKLETETKKILGTPGMIISAHCNRVPVSDGHTASVSITFSKQPSQEEIIAAWRGFKAPMAKPALPTGPEFPLRYFDETDFPQPKKHRNLEEGMLVSIGRLRPCPLFHNKFTILSHNTMRGAAGGAILTAELLLRKGFIYW